MCYPHVCLGPTEISFGLKQNIVRILSLFSLCGNHKALACIPAKVQWFMYMLESLKETLSRDMCIWV